MKKKMNKNRLTPFFLFSLLLPRVFITKSVNTKNFSPYCLKKIIYIYIKITGRYDGYFSDYPVT